MIIDVHHGCDNCDPSSIEYTLEYLCPGLWNYDAWTTGPGKKLRCIEFVYEEETLRVCSNTASRLNGGEGACEAPTSELTSDWSATAMKTKRGPRRNSSCQPIASSAIFRFLATPMAQNNVHFNIGYDKLSSILIRVCLSEQGRHVYTSNFSSNLKENVANHVLRKVSLLCMERFRTILFLEKFFQKWITLSYYERSLQQHHSESAGTSAFSPSPKIGSRTGRSASRTASARTLCGWLNRPTTKDLTKYIHFKTW